jgi:hypothetical protein
MISPASLWNIPLENRRRMRAVLEGCPDGWWEILTKQGNSRRQLKGINEIGNITGGDVRQQIEAMMHLYLDFIKNQYPCLRYWRVGALQTKPNTQSQYKKSGNQLHSDYSETALRREPGERPMSMIMALDESFNFLYENKDINNDDGVVHANVGQKLVICDILRDFFGDRFRFCDATLS